MRGEIVEGGGAMVCFPADGGETLENDIPEVIIEVLLKELLNLLLDLFSMSLHWLPKLSQSQLPHSLRNGDFSVNPFPSARPSSYLDRRRGEVLRKVRQVKRILELIEFLALLLSLFFSLTVRA